MVDELYVVARSVLLDALEAIKDHRNAVILVGAQAIYLRVGDADLAVAPYTTDGDLAIDPEILDEIPPIEEALQSAGFSPDSEQSVGIWIAHRETSQHSNVRVAVDLLVPKSLSPGKSRRSARLPGHDKKTARKVQGLDGTVVDTDWMTLEALAPDDNRSLQIRVAGPASLLVAKVYKINDRQGSTRVSDKDALDVLRLLQGTETEELADRFQTLLDDERSREIVGEAINLFREQFSTPESPGIEMAIRAVGPLMDPELVKASCLVLAQDLLQKLETSD